MLGRPRLLAPRRRASAAFATSSVPIRRAALLQRNPKPCDVLAVVNVESAARRWAETWQRAWPAKQSAQIAALYHEAASYRSSPFREPEAGGALGYVERQFAIEEAVECRFAEPITAGDRAAVEWWASYIETGQAITLAGATVLRFNSDGLVVEQVDYWVQGPSRIAPYPGWGE
jgi:SnoaL-like domain